MTSIQEQLTLLRQKVARIDRKYAPPLPSRQCAAEFVEEILSGQVVETPQGKHFETEKLYEKHRRHGSVNIYDLLDLPDDLLDRLSDGAILKCDPRKWAFLDTETTGLAGGTGTYAFLIGVGSIDDEGFRVRQFFMRDYGEEASQLYALAEYLQRFDVLISYNGKAYDQPLLETRFRMVRSKHPFERLEHLDLLFGARRLWKLRLDSCRLVHLENQVLGIERHGDLPGEMIPYYYFEFLNTQRAFRLVPIFHHNMMDIVTLACLTAIVPEAFRAPERIAMRHGADLLGLARWLVQAEQLEQALTLFRRAIDLGLRDELLFRTMLDTGLLEKKLGRDAAALVMFTDLAASANPFRVRAMEELAKHYEHRERNYAMALEMTRNALEHRDVPEIRRREERLKKRVSGAARSPSQSRRPASRSRP
jgi:uncharacterized protein YprB with RNaseH-like and TPR domain